ncbi:MAG: GNAT family N-acetyltransferase [Bacteroidales bacterium]|nr:GNAT family N-acetyltransferase [Bacteroidales bacterium]
MTLKSLPGASLSSGSITFYAYPTPVDTEPVGTVELYAYDPLNRRAAIGVAVATDHRHKGYATAMIAELERLCSEVYALHQLYCDVAVVNTASTALFKKCGYKICGQMQEWVEIGDKWIDVLRLQKML